MMGLTSISRYGVAVAAAGAALLLRMALDPLWGLQMPFISFFPAIMVSAWFGGFWPGIATTLLSALAAAYFWIAPVRSLALEPAGLAGLALFIGIGAVISGFNEAWRRAASALRASEERLRVTVESIGDAVIATDERGCITRLNRLARALTGWTAKEAKGRLLEEVFTIVHEETRQPMESPVASVLREDAAIGPAGHTLLLSKDGRETPIDYSVALIRGADERVLGAVMVFRDVTERRRTEREHAGLLEKAQAARSKAETSEHQLRLALEAGHMGTWQWTLESGRVEWSPGLEAIHGYAAGTFAGTFEAFRKEIHPEDRDRVLRSVSEAAEGARNHYVEYRILRPDGSIRWLEARGQLVRDARGRPERMVGVCIDVTERKQVEETFQTAIEAAPAAMIIADREGTIVFVNGLSESLFGYSRGELVGRSIDELVPLRFRDRHADHRRSFATEPLRRPMGAGRDLYALRKDGSEVPVEIGLSPIETDGGLVVLAAITDITERKRIERERESLLAREQAAREEIEKASRFKDEFLTVLSHELRTPLSAVIGWARLLGAGALSPEQSRDAVQAIQRNAQAEARLVESLLDLSRIRAGKLQLEVRPVDLSAVVRAAVEMFRPEAEAKGLRVESHIPSSPVVLSGDGDRLQQIVWNLLSNAVKFTPSGGRVQVFLEREDSRARIRVADDGEGIDAELLPHVFDRFTQGNAAKTTSRHGLGLGLSIVRELVRAHGGAVSAESPGPGQGSTFTITFPLSDGSATVDAFPPDPPAIEAEATSPSIAELDVLVVDDDPEARDLLTLMLEAQGASVRTASSSKEALDSIRESEPDVLLADIAMPREDGYQMIRKLRASEGEEGRRRLPAIALTAFAARSDEEKALASGFDGHLAKPVELAELLRLVAELAGSAGFSSAGT